MYFRSQDGGTTWDIQDSILSGLDSNSFTGFRGDAYSVIADGNKVAIGIFNQWADMVLLKSADNGDTWTNTLINDCPVDLYVADQRGGSDADNDGNPDTLETCDQAGTILFDAQGMVHASFGRMRVLDADLTDGNTTYFPGTQELLYWNENMGTGNFQEVAFPADIDGDGQLGFAGEFSAYFVALCGFPSMGISDDGTLFISYAGYVESFQTATQNYRHIHIVKSSDGGVSWTEPFDLTPDLDENYYEHVFPHMAPQVDNKVRIMYMRDFEPGLAARGDEDPYGLNEMIYMTADTAFSISGVGLNELAGENLSVSLYPNPSKDKVTIEFNLENFENVKIELFNINGQLVRTIAPNVFSVGDNKLEFSTASLANGTYIVKGTLNGAVESKELLVRH